MGQLTGLVIINLLFGFLIPGIDIPTFAWPAPASSPACCSCPARAHDAVVLVWRPGPTPWHRAPVFGRPATGPSASGDGAPRSRAPSSCGALGPRPGRRPCSRRSRSRRRVSEAGGIDGGPRGRVAAGSLDPARLEVAIEAGSPRLVGVQAVAGLTSSPTARSPSRAAGWPRSPARTPAATACWRVRGHATAALSDRAMARRIPGPYSLGRRVHDGLGAARRTEFSHELADRLAGELRALASAGAARWCWWTSRPRSVSATRRTRRPTRRSASCSCPPSATACRGARPPRHARLAGGSAWPAGAPTILHAPFQSYLFDLIQGPDNWYLVRASRRSRRGLRCLAPRSVATRRRSSCGRHAMPPRRRPRPGTGRPGQRTPLLGLEPASVRRAVDALVRRTGWPRCRQRRRSPRASIPARSEGLRNVRGSRPSATASSGAAPPAGLHGRGRRPRDAPTRAPGRWGRPVGQADPFRGRGRSKRRRSVPPTRARAPGRRRSRGARPRRPRPDRRGRPARGASCRGPRRVEQVRLIRRAEDRGAPAATRIPRRCRAWRGARAPRRAAAPGGREQRALRRSASSSASCRSRSRRARRPPPSRSRPRRAPELAASRRPARG